MKKSPEQIFEEFQKELMENDKKVQKEINKNDRVEMSKEFAKFIKENNCKIITGGKNGKTRKNS